MPLAISPPLPTKELPDNFERIGVSVEQAAVMLSLSVRSVWVLIKNGRIKHVRFGKRCIVSVQSLREYVDGKQSVAHCLEDNIEEQDEAE